jgi:hypothetical protein
MGRNTGKRHCLQGTSKNSELCVTRPRQNAHLPNENPLLLRAQALVLKFLDVPFRDSGHWGETP